MWFGYYPEIIFCHFFCNLNLVIFKCTIMAGDINSLNLLVYFDFIRSTTIKKEIQRSSSFTILQGVNAFDFSEPLNLIGKLNMLFFPC